jgi:hypothetical protein
MVDIILEVSELLHPVVEAVELHLSIPSLILILIWLLPVEEVLQWARMGLMVIQGMVPPPMAVFLPVANTRLQVEEDGRGMVTMDT